MRAAAVGSAAATAAAAATGFAGREDECREGGGGGLALVLDHKSLGPIACDGPGAQTLVVRTLIEPTRVSPE
jgi:hypothetical protein